MRCAILLAIAVGCHRVTVLRTATRFIEFRVSLAALLRSLGQEPDAPASLGPHWVLDHPLSMDLIPGGAPA